MSMMTRKEAIQVLTNDVFNIEEIDKVCEAVTMAIEALEEQEKRMNDEERTLTGATIVRAKVNEYGVTLTLSDGNVFVYEPSDGGYSTYEIYKKGE